MSAVATTSKGASQGAHPKPTGSGSQGTRRARVLKRTWVGGGLALAVAALLYLSSGPGGARFVLAAGVVLSLWSIVEVQRAGLFAGRGAAFAAAAATVTAAVLAFVWLDPGAPRRFPLDWTPEQVWWRGLGGIVGAVALVGVVGTLPGVSAGPRPIEQRRAWPTLLLVFWLAAPLLTLYPLRHVLGVQGLIAFLLLAKFGDVAGYYVGNAIGETHPFPRISPGKTTAGCVASLVAGVAAGVALHAGGLLPEGKLGLVSGALAGLGVNLAAQAGDLFESAAKRRVGIKDSATTFGPSGGMLDLVDSILFAGPVALVTWPLLFHWPL
ncbi:MAG: phosphatidate cytidylyltransferase [Planctomycetota bacterium]